MQVDLTYSFLLLTDISIKEKNLLANTQHMIQRNNIKTEEHKYLVNISYVNKEMKEEMEVITDDLAFIMDQYQRNRDPFKWKFIIIEEL
jgi:hypothetical protein